MGKLKVGMRPSACSNGTGGGTDGYGYNTGAAVNLRREGTLEKKRRRWGRGEQSGERREVKPKAQEDGHIGGAREGNLKCK